MTRQVFAGRVAIGGGAPVSVQTMTNTDTRDVEATLNQIRAMAEAGADIVRVSVYDEACAEAVRALVDGSPVPLVADIHFNHRLAIRAIENGISKVRINPGNIGGEGNVRELADCLKQYRIPVRIGVNSGSIEKDLLEKYGGVTAQGMVESGLNHARMLERAGYDQIVLSYKATDVPKTVEACRLAAKLSDYPQHIGVTESGTADVGVVKSAVGIGALLLEGIGDTIRVSLSGDPVQEVRRGAGHSARLRAAPGRRRDRVLSHLRPHGHRRGGHRPARARGHEGYSRAAEGGRDGLHRQRPRRGAGGRSGHCRRPRRRRAVREEPAAPGGEGRSGPGAHRRNSKDGRFRCLSGGQLHHRP